MLFDDPERLRDERDHDRAADRDDENLEDVVAAPLLKRRLRVVAALEQAEPAPRPQWQGCPRIDRMITRTKAAIPLNIASLAHVGSGRVFLHAAGGGASVVRTRPSVAGSPREEPGT